MKKILTLIIAPLLSGIVLFGCVTGTKLTTNNTKNKFNQFMDSYIETRIDNAYNQIFKNNLVATGQEGDELGTNYEKIMYIEYKNKDLSDAINGTLNKELTDYLRVNYSQIKNTYQRVLSLSYNYYANWSDNFFSSIENTEITNKEINTLFERLEKLESVTRSFKQSKSSLEDAVLPGINQQQNISSALALHQEEYVNMIKASFSFINYFRDLHVKYIFNSNTVGLQSSQRLVDEALLLISEGVFYDNVLANKIIVNVNLYDFMTSTYSKNSKYNWLKSQDWQKLTVNVQGSIYANREMNAKVYAAESTTIKDVLYENSTESQEFAVVSEKINQLSIFIKNFKQNLEYYKEIQKNVSLENYAYFRGVKIPNSSLSFDREKLTVKEETDFKFMSEFAYDKLSAMFESIYLLISNTI